MWPDMLSPLEHPICFSLPLQLSSHYHKHRVTEWFQSAIVSHVCITYDLISLLPLLSPTNAALGRYKGTVSFLFPPRLHSQHPHRSRQSGVVIVIRNSGHLFVSSMGVRVMDTSWVSRKGSSTLARKTSSTPPGMQGPGSPADTLIPEQPGELTTSPSATPPPGDRLW